MNPLKFTFPYNGEIYRMTFVFYNDDISLSSPDKITNDEDVLGISEQFGYIKISNSMASWTPKIELEINDDYLSVANYLKMQNTRINVIIGKNEESKGSYEMNLNFIVTGFKLSEKEQTASKTTYKVFGELDTAIPLNTQCKYATACSLETDNEQMENPLEIAKSILQQVGYRTYATNQTGPNGSPVPTKYDLPYTNERCHFITSTDMTCKKALEYLFSYAIGENATSSPVYLVHNLYDNLGYITSFDEIFKKSSIVMQPDVSKIPFSMTEPLVNSQYYNITNVNMILDAGDDPLPTGINASKLLHNYKFYEYSQENREWENYAISKLAVNDIITKGINHASETSLYLHSYSEDIDHSLYYQEPPLSHPKLYDAMRLLELFGSILRFTVFGNILLDVGQVIFINETGSEGSRVEQLHGRWVIIKIEHSWKNQEYHTHVVCSRRFNSVRKKFGQ